MAISLPNDMKRLASICKPSLEMHIENKKTSDFHTINIPLPDTPVHSSNVITCLRYCATIYWYLYKLAHWVKNGHKVQIHLAVYFQCTLFLVDTS